MKKRLTGAVVLVALVVIFVPMILDDRDPRVELGPLIPEQPNDSFAEEMIPPEEVTQARPVDIGDKQRYELPVGEVMESPSTKPVEKAPQANKPAEVAKPAEVIKAPEPVKVEVTPPKSTYGEVVSNGWVIQAGSFGQRENADNLVKKLTSSGRSAFIEPIDVKGKVLYRVRIGPIADRAVADKELTTVEKEFQLKGKVLAFP